VTTIAKPITPATLEEAVDLLDRVRDRLALARHDDHVTAHCETYEDIVEADPDGTTPHTTDALVAAAYGGIRFHDKLADDLFEIVGDPDVEDGLR
jgi:hypothetical protein